MRARIVSFHCTVRNQVGQVISSTFNRDVIAHAEGPSTLLKGLAKGLQKLKKGQKRRIFLSADQAYGFYDPRLIMQLPRKKFARETELHIGQEILIQNKAGAHKTFRVAQINSRSVTLDGNHPLAGQDLLFEVEAIDARDATSEEMEEAVSRDRTPVLH